MTPAVHHTCPLCSPCVALRRIRILNNKQKSVSVSSEVTKYLFLAGPATEGLLRQRDDENLYFHRGSSLIQIDTCPKHERN